MKTTLLTVALATTAVLTTAQTNVLDWAYKTGTQYNILAVDAVGNTYRGGAFTGTVDFDWGTGVANETASNYKMYITKYNTAGQFMWVKTIKMTSVGGMRAISLDKNANILITGAFNDSTDFDPSANTASLIPKGFDDVFVAKYDSSGNYIWAKQFSGQLDEVGTAICADEQGNVCTSGYFLDNVDFNPGAAVLNLNSSGQFSPFVVKLDKNGNFLWAKKLSGARSYAIRTDKQNNLYAGGDFWQAADFDPSTTGTTTLTPKGDYDVFITKLDSNGTFGWASSYGTSKTDYLRLSAMSVDNGGSVYITGAFTDTLHNSTDTATLRAIGESDIFILKFNANGKLAWAKQVGNVKTGNYTSTNAGWKVALDAQAKVYTIGNYSAGNNAIDFNPNAGVYNITSVSGNNSGLFILKLDSTGKFNWVGKYAGLNVYCDAVCIDNANNIYTTGSFNGTVDFNPSLNASDTFSLKTNNNYDGFVNKFVQLPLVNNIRNNNQAFNNITIYPNPAHTTVTVVTPTININAPMRIVNVLGQVVLTQIITGATITINVNELPKGIYFVTIDNSTTQKLIID
ncbi:MAG: T9SS type A sorting domain-containing protein [Bacteroidia bacterium]|nr:T9SS type A sorting domain-containing protein [Bacteroidia bacterium]